MPKAPIKHYIFDFDSTFSKVEGMDELAALSLAGRPDAEGVIQRIKELTDLAMEGELSFRQSLKERLLLLSANKSHLDQLVEILKEKVSDSFVRNHRFFTEHVDQIYVVSSGFRDFIVPVVTSFGLKPEHVYANSYTFDDQGYIIGFDETNVLSEDQGKVKLLEQLALQGEIHVVGDGFTDYEMKQAGLAHRFYAFTENVKRTFVAENADVISPTLDEFLYQNKLPMALSYPKNRIKNLFFKGIF
jgi:D-3-phosphoglycerate dehydrogenase